MPMPPVLGFDQGYNIYNNPNLTMRQRVGLDPIDAPPQPPGYNPNDPRLVGGVSPYIAQYGPPLTGPQQSYSPVSNQQASNDGVSGQAGRQDTSYNSTPYNPNNGNSMTAGAIGNTGAPQGQTQGELVGQGGRGWNIYQTTPTWTGSPNSQSPPARSEGDFGRSKSQQEVLQQAMMQAPQQQAPLLAGPQNPALQQLRQQLIARAFQNMPRGYQFKLG